MNKESAFYLRAAQGFQGIEDATVNIGSKYELYRSVYPYLLRIFWFLEPIEAVLMLDVLIWFLACLSIWGLARNLGLSPMVQFFAVFFTVFAQGFLQSLGEGMPHVVGYASGYFICFLLSQVRPWRRDASLQDDLLPYGFVGIWQLAYGTAFFFLPLLLGATLTRYYQQRYFRVKEFLGLIALAVVPYLIFSFFMKVSLKTSGGVSEIVFSKILHEYQTVGRFLIAYIRTLADSYFALGPIALVGAVGLWKAWRENIWLVQALTLTTILQFMGMAVLLIPLAGRGYATFNFYVALCLGGAFILGRLWSQKVFWKRLSVVVFCLAWGGYVSAGRFGFILFDRLFFTGFINMKDSWWQYALKIFL